MPRHELTKAQQMRVAPLLVEAMRGRTQTELAKEIGLTSHSQVSRATETGALSRMSAFLLCRLLGKDPSIIGLGDLCPLAATHGWEEASADLDDASKETIGRTIPPQRLARVTPITVQMYRAAWLAGSPHVDAATEHATHAPEAGPEPTEKLAPFGVAGARAAKKRARQAT